MGLLLNPYRFAAAGTPLPSPLWDLDFAPGGAPVSLTSAASLLSGAGFAFSRSGGSSQYFDPATGFLESVDANTPRVETPGLLLEGSYTGILIRNNALDNATWVKSSLSVTADAQLAITGGTSSDKITYLAATHELYQQLTVTPLTTYCFSFWAQRGTAADASYGVRDVTNGTDIVGSTSYIGQTNTSIPSRIDVPFTAPAGCTSVRVYPLRNSGVSSGTMFISTCWCAALPFWARHLGTVGLSLTSNADLCSDTVAGHTAGALIVRGRTARGVRTGVDQVLAQADDTTANNVVRLKRDGSRNIIAEARNGGSAIASMTLGSVADDTEFTAGFSFATNNFRARLSGGSELTDVAGTMPTLTRIRLGGAASSGSEWFGNLRRAQRFSAALSSGDLASLVAQAAA